MVSHCRRQMPPGGPAAGIGGAAHPRAFRADIRPRSYRVEARGPREGQLQALPHNRANPQGYQAPSFREDCLMGPKCADTCHAGRPQAAILWIHRGMSPPPEIDDFALLEAWVRGTAPS